MSQLTCTDESISGEIARIQKIGGYCYAVVYVGFLCFIFILAVITDHKRTKNASKNIEPMQKNITKTMIDTADSQTLDDFKQENKETTYNEEEKHDTILLIGDINDSVAKNENSLLVRIKNIGKEMMRIRAIYFVILVHIFDTLTDFLIMLEWYFKGKYERQGIIDCPNLNYFGCFVISIIILLFYRILSAQYVFKYYQQTKLKAFISSILQFLDISIFYEVYQSHIHRTQTDNLSYISKLEKTFESSPQLILQLYVLMRELSQEESVQISPITIISILFSLVSLSTKVIHDDQLMYVKEANKKNKFIYWVRALFRICEISTRLLCFTLFATFFGANFLLLIIILDLLTNLLLYDHGLLDFDPLNCMSYLLCTMNMGIIATQDHRLISKQFMQRHTIFQKIWKFLFKLMTRMQMIYIPCYKNKKCDHYLSYYLIRSKCIQSFIILFIISIFSIIDNYSNWHFDCIICQDFDGRQSLYKSTEFNVFLCFAFFSCGVCYATFSFINVNYMLPGMILDRDAWVLFINFNFFDAIRAYIEREGPDAFNLKDTLKKIINLNVRLPSLPQTHPIYDEEAIITEFPQLSYLIREINELHDKSFLYQYLETAIVKLHDNFLSFFLNCYIIDKLENYDPISYINTARQNLLEIAIQNENNVIIQTVFYNLPKLIELNLYENNPWFDVWKEKFSSTIIFMIRHKPDLIEVLHPMEAKCITAYCLKHKHKSTLNLLQKNFEISRNKIKLVNEENYDESEMVNDDAGIISKIAYIDKIIQTDQVDIFNLFCQHYHIEYTWRKSGDTLITLCTRYNCINLLKWCVENIKNKQQVIDIHMKVSPFEYALSSEVCQQLYNFGFQVPNYTNNIRRSLIYKHCIAQRQDVVKWLVVHGCKLSDNSLLVDVSMNGLHVCYPSLIPICDLQNDNNNILHLAVMSRNITSIRILLSNGFDINDTDNIGKTPLHYIAESDNDILKDLLLILITRFEANVNATDNFGNTMLHLLCGNSRDYLKILWNILFDDNINIDLNMQNVHGDTALHIAIKTFEHHNDIERIKTLIKANIDVNIFNKNGHSAIMLALDYNLDRVVKVLLKAKCKVSNLLPFVIDIAIQNEQRHNKKKYKKYLEYFFDLMMYGSEFEFDNNTFNALQNQKELSDFKRIYNYWHIKQYYVEINEENKLQTLLSLLETISECKCVIYCTHKYSFNTLMKHYWNRFKNEFEDEYKSEFHKFSEKFKYSFDNAVVHFQHFKQKYKDDFKETFDEATECKLFEELKEFYLQTNDLENEDVLRKEILSKIKGNINFKLENWKYYYVFEKELENTNSNFDLNKLKTYQSFVENFKTFKTYVYNKLETETKHKSKIDLYTEFQTELTKFKRFIKEKNDSEIATINEMKELFKQRYEQEFRINFDEEFENKFGVNMCTSDKAINLAKNKLRILIAMSNATLTGIAPVVISYDIPINKEDKIVKNVRNYVQRISASCGILINFIDEKEKEYLNQMTGWNYDIIQKLPGFSNAYEESKVECADRRQYKMSYPDKLIYNETKQNERYYEQQPIWMEQFMNKRLNKKGVATELYNNLKNYNINLTAIYESKTENEYPEQDVHLIKDYRVSDEKECVVMINGNGNGNVSKSKQILDAYLAMLDMNDSSKFVEAYFNEIIIKYIWDENWLLLNNICSASQYEPILINVYKHSKFKESLNEIICKVKHNNVNPSMNQLMVESLTFAYDTSYIAAKTNKNHNFNDTDQTVTIQETIEYIMTQTIYKKLKNSSDMLESNVSNLINDASKGTMDVFIDDNKHNLRDIETMYALGLTELFITEQMQKSNYSKDEINTFCTSKTQIKTNTKKHIKMWFGDVYNKKASIANDNRDTTILQESKAPDDNDMQKNKKNKRKNDMKAAILAAKQKAKKKGDGGQTPITSFVDKKDEDDDSDGSDDIKSNETEKIRKHYKKKKSKKKRKKNKKKKGGSFTLKEREDVKSIWSDDDAKDELKTQISNKVQCYSVLRGVGGEWLTKLINTGDKQLIYAIFFRSKTTKEYIEKQVKETLTCIDYQNDAAKMIDTIKSKNIQKYTKLIMIDDEQLIQLPEMYSVDIPFIDIFINYDDTKDIANYQRRIKTYGGPKQLLINAITHINNTNGYKILNKKINNVISLPWHETKNYFMYNFIDDPIIDIDIDEKNEAHMIENINNNLLDIEAHNVYFQTRPTEAHIKNRIYLHRLVEQIAVVKRPMNASIRNLKKCCLEFIPIEMDNSSNKSKKKSNKKDNSLLFGSTKFGFDIMGLSAMDCMVFITEEKYAFSIKDNLLYLQLIQFLLKKIAIIPDFSKQAHVNHGYLGHYAINQFVRILLNEESIKQCEQNTNDLIDDIKNDEIGNGDVSKYKGAEYSLKSKVCWENSIAPHIKIFDAFYNVELNLYITTEKEQWIKRTIQIQTELNLDKRIKLLIVNIKYWTRMRNIWNVQIGYLQPYCWYLMCIEYAKNNVVKQNENNRLDAMLFDFFCYWSNKSAPDYAINAEKSQIDKTWLEIKRAETLLTNKKSWVQTICCRDVI